MNKQLLDKFPTWYKDIDKDKYYMVLSNDFDSYFSCKLLHNLFGITIGGYFDLNRGLYLNPERSKGKEPIYIDLSITKGKSFDNHYTFFKNPESINPNIICDTYYKKFNGSTLALLCSFYNRNLSKYSQQSLTALLCIDGWYIGYYNKGGRYKDVNIYWYKMFDMDKYLLPVLQEHDNQYFIDFISHNNLDAKITIANNHLHCNVKCGLPQYEFELVQPVKKEFLYEYQIEEHDDSILTAAECYKHQYSICRKAG